MLKEGMENRSLIRKPGNHEDTASEVLDFPPRRICDLASL
jgi:hypothetical protein